MQFFAETFARLTAYQELCNAMEQGIQPISLTGVAQVHKAHLLAALCSTHAPRLAVTAEEAEARRLCDDINTMLDQTAAWQFPSRELVLTPVEGVTVSYEHARIAALTAMRQGQCRVIIASIEALLQPTIAPEALEEHTLVLNSSSSIAKDSPTTSPPTCSTSLVTAAIVPPVASKSSTIKTRCPGLMLSECIVSVSVPYSFS